MKKFKTNIKCEACVVKVTPGLNEVAGIGNWQVDLTNPLRILTVQGDLSETKINEALQQKGYKVEVIDE